MTKLNTRLCLMLTALLVPALMHAQERGDTADVFYKHLRINELTVTGVTGQTRLRDIASPASVVTSRELRASVGTNIIDAISHQPGLAQLTTGSGISKPVIRGLGYNRVLVVSDGVRQEGQQWGDEHGVEIDPQGVGSVEILKGPASLMYGSDALAGVLIMHSRPLPAEGQTEGSVSMEGHTNSGLLAGSLYMAGHSRGVVWSARYSERAAHEYKAPDDGYVPGTQMHERAASALVGLDRTWGHTHLKIDAYGLTPSMAEGERDATTGRLAHDYGLKTYHRQLPFQRVGHYKVTADNALALGQGMLKAIVAYQQNRRREYEDDTAEPELYFRLHTLTYDLRYAVTTAHGWQTAAGVGGMWQRSQNLADETLIPAYRLFDIGAYATTQRSLGRLTVSGGLRGDRRHVSHYGHFSGLTGSIGAVAHVAEGLNMRLNLARGFRAPNMSELGSDGVHEGTLRYETGNPDLKAEHNWQADLGADFQGRLLSAQLSLFLNRVGNYIFAARMPDDVVHDGELWRHYAYTQGDAVLKGFEASADFHPVHQVHLGTSFSYVDARQLHRSADTRFLPMTPAPRWTSDLKWELTHDGRRLNNSYVAATVDVFLAQTHYYRADMTETRTPSYTLLGATAGTDLLVCGRKVAEISLTVQNLLNRAYQSHMSRLKYTEANPLTARTGINNPGRNIALKLMLPIEL